MNNVKKNDQWMSFAGVVLLALILPGLLRAVNSVARYIVGAEGRLAALNVDTDRTLGLMAKNWKGLAQGGDNLKGFMDQASTELIRLQPEYIRLDHIYDEFGVVDKRDDQLTYNWVELDKLVTQITAVGAKPFFSLSYMPRVIATDGDILSEPKDWNDWADVVQKTVEHYSGAMGLENVYYEVWNEPDLFGKWTIGGKKDYRSLYAYAVAGAQRAKDTKQFKIGGAATTGLYKNWVDKFLPYILQNNIRLDFFSWHRYDLNSNIYSKDVKNAEEWIDNHPYFRQTEKIVSEMGPSSEMGRENDTQTGAAHLVTIARELMPKVKYGFNFAIAGNWGIVGKPRQKALEFLDRLGDYRLPVTGEGTWVKAIAAADGDNMRVVLTNYDPKNAHSENVPVTFLNLKKNRYTLIVEMLDGIKTTTGVATSEAKFQTIVSMPANSVAIVELLSTDETN